VVVTAVGAAVGDGLGMAAFGAGGLLASVSRASMLKWTVGERGVFLGALGRGVSKLIAVCTLGVVVSLRLFSTLRHFEKRKRAGRWRGTSSALMELSTEVACLESLAARSLLRYLAAPSMTSFAL